MRKVMVAMTAADRGGPIPDGREKGKERTSRKAAMSAAMKNCPESGAISGCWGRANGTSSSSGGVSRQRRPLRFG